MQTKHYLLALVPLLAVWMYAVSESAERMFHLFDEAPPRDAAASTSSAAPDALPLVAPSEPAEAAAHAPAVQPAAGPDDIEGYEFLPRGEPQPAGAGSDYAARDETLAHPDITDPHMRALLRPAWED